MCIYHFKDIKHTKCVGGWICESSKVVPSKFRVWFEIFGKTPFGWQYYITCSAENWNHGKNPFDPENESIWYAGPKNIII